MANPVINPDVGLSPVEGGYLAYDSVRDYVHELNAMGALIAELCDGSLSVEEIRALAGPLMPEGQTTGIDGWISAGIEAGLLVWGDGTRARPRELTAEELIGLADKLRGSGMSETYFLCLKRVTELTPENSDTWHALGFAAQAVGRREDARNAFAQYLEYHPEDASIRHVLTALRDEAPPPRAPDDCILQIFKDFSSHYDAKMRDNLSYQAPERIQELIRAEMGDAAGLEILDIGCGTGLSGVGLKERAACLVGIDLSPEMIDVARERDIYDQLEIAEITEWLDQTEGQFDLIVACDCLVYFGDLQPVAALAAGRLKPGGCFAFTTERGEKYPFHLSDSGRYTHHPEHVREVAAKAGLVVGRLDEGFLRLERGVEVIGLLALLRKVGGDCSGRNA
ncbi:MAG TPA: methyltransferase domain-containing protein [Terracidiphilus sp.]|jgi:predicted TPR repeat methyltransferase